MGNDFKGIFNTMRGRVWIACFVQFRIDIDYHDLLQVLNECLLRACEGFIGEQNARVVQDQSLLRLGVVVGGFAICRALFSSDLRLQPDHAHPHISHYRPTFHHWISLHSFLNLFRCLFRIDTLSWLTKTFNPTPSAIKALSILDTNTYPSLFSMR